MIKGLVSAIIPVFNRADMLREAVASVLAQTYRPIDIIIIDDGSTDETANIADELGNTNDEIKIIHQMNSGPGMAREAGRLQAEGEFIQYLDSDDLLLPEKFEKQIAGLQMNQDCGVSYCITRYLGTDGEVLEEPWKRTGEKIGSLFPSMLLDRWWGTSTPLYRKSLIDIGGPWLNLINEEDWEYDCRLATHNVKLDYIPVVLSEERDHKGSRMSGGGNIEPMKLASRAMAHELIFDHAIVAGINKSSIEMQYFARELFLLSRQCGAAGLGEESKKLFNLSRNASGSERSSKLDFKVYQLGGEILGWSAMGKLSCYLDRLRR